MNVIKFDPFKELKNLENKMFDLYGEKKDKTTIAGFMPTINTREEDESYYIDIDLPGVRKEEIDIDVQENMLVVSGERKHKKALKEEDYYKMESYFGKFQRSFALPDDANTEAIEAKSVDGVLEVVIPKSEPMAKRKIEIR